MKKIITSVGVTLCLLATSNLKAQNNKYATGPRHFVLPETMVEDIDYMKGHIIFAVKEQYRSKCSAGYINDVKLTQVVNYLNVNSLGKIYPDHQPPAEKVNKMGQRYADLSLTYELTFKNTGISLEKAINLVLSTGLFEYAEPRYQYKVSTFVPNEPNVATNQPYLTAIKAYVAAGTGGAWDTSDPLVGPAGQGDTNVVIGIVDSGTDTDHPDLKNQFKHNYADPIGGGDDDNDGYTDNFTGWDLAGADYNNVVGDNDPNVMGSNNTHGSHVSGCASAQVNNGVGACGIGFKCKLLPVKCAADNDTRGTGGEGYIITGYEGITYAADHGARVINCSWGGTGGGSYGQSIIDYASINKNALVVCAAGNDGLDEIIFPAGFNYALAVAASSSGSTWRTKAGFSNYNYSVDITSPGNNIYNTVWNNSYTSMSGTSMASPITAGGAALVLSKWPTYTGLQAGQRLITTGDNVNAVNPAYANKMGGGRINLYNALTMAAAPSVVFTNQLVTDHNDLAFVNGDTLFISGDFINYLNPTTSACTSVIGVAAGGTNLTAINTSFPIGVLGTNSTLNSSSAPYKYKVITSTINTTVTFSVSITDGSYNQKYFFNVLLNPDYVNVNINDVATTITSKGKIGWNADGATTGLGFSYMGNQLLYEAGLMIGSSSTKVSDCVRGTTAGTSDADFANLVVAQKVGPTVSDFDVTTKFNDAPASPTQSVTVHQNAYAWTTPGSRKFVICEYIIKNTGSTTFNTGYAGIFADWDIDASTYGSNKSDYDAARRMGYTWATIGGMWYAGIKLLTTGANPNFYGIDNAGTGRGGVNITSAFTTADKYTTLSTMRTKAGDSTLVTYPGNDVCNVMSAGPFSIAAGDSITVAFALIAGDNLTQLQTSADTAQIRYDHTTGIAKNNMDVKHFVVFPNPANDALNFVFGSGQAEYSVSLVNVMGQTVKTVKLNAAATGINSVNMDVSELPAGTYIYKIADKNGKTEMGKVIVRH